MASSKVAIIYLCWADEPKKYLARALDAVISQSYNRENLMLVIVYNGPRKDGLSELKFIQSEVDYKKDTLPETVVLTPDSNIGFSAGNNFGARYAVLHGADYIFLHNADGYLADNAIQKMVEVMGLDREIGECQPLICLYPETELINSFGNAFHYLGFGYCSNYRERKTNDYLQVYSIGYTSGAAAFMRADLLKEFGYWDEDFFLYHEDTEYSIRLKLLGYKISLAAQAIFYHQYDFSNKPNKFFWIERNRHALKLLFYKWPTIILLLPLEILFNLGLIIVSVIQGWHRELFNVYAYWCNPKNWSSWLKKRKIIQTKRKISDRQLLASTHTTVGIADLKIPFIVRIFANIVFTIYWFLLKILIWW